MATDQRFLDFLHTEMRRRDFTSVRQFAAWLGMSNSMVAQVMDGKRDPGLTFMVALAQKTGVNISDLIELAQPGTFTRTDLSLGARITAQQIDQLGDADRALLEGFIRARREGMKHGQ